MFKDKNILITGGKGMIGRALTKLIEKESPRYIKIADLPEYDLRDRKDCETICDGQDIVFHLAGIKGSPQRCMEEPASFSVPMIQFNANMVEAAYNADVEWFLYTSSIGVYEPASVFLEDDLWNGFPSKLDWYGGWAKRMGELNVEASMIEYGRNNCSIVRPANIYGKWDIFNDKATVVGSLINKGYQDDVLTVWGDGTPIRDFIYSKDVAMGMLHMVENEVTKPVNLGSGEGVTIKEISEIIANYFSKDIIWDSEKPMGDVKRLMSVERSESYGFKPQVSLEDGLVRTMKWYEEYGYEL